MTTLPVGAAVWTRAARFGVSPTISPGRVQAPSSSPDVTANPVWMPIRTLSANPACAARAGIRLTASAIASPVSTARSPSSSCARGYP